MPTIEFEQYERDCPFNDSIRKKGEPTRGLIRDFRVLIDGEHRACFKQNRYSSRGQQYNLTDADWRHIKHAMPGRSGPQPIYAASQAVFDQVVDNALRAKAIPTLEQLAEMRAADKIDAAQRAIDQQETNKRMRLEQSSSSLYGALKQLYACFDAEGKVFEEFTDQLSVALETAEAAILKADGVNFPKAKSPGDTIEIRHLKRDDELGDVRIQDYSGIGKPHFRIASFIPGRYVCNEGDTPKTEPDACTWATRKIVAVAYFEQFLRSALEDGWVIVEGRG